MKTQYLFEVVLTRLTLKKGLKAQAYLHLALIKNYDSLSNNSTSGQTNTQKLKIRKIQKIIDLQKLTYFKFIKDQESKSIQNTVIQLSLQGEFEKIEFIELKTVQLISQFQINKKSIFEKKIEWSLGDLEMKIHLLTKEAEPLILNVFDPTLEKVSSFKSNSMSRTKRPPELNISRKGALATSQSKQNETLQDLVKKDKNQYLLKLEQRKQKAVSASAEKKQVSPRFKQKETSSPFYPETFSALTLFKRKQKKVQLQNEHVKGLIESHHPQEQYEVNTSQLSIKLKSVILLLFIGFLFLIVDTLTDRSIKKFFKKNPHPVHSTKKQQKKGYKPKSKKTKL